MIYAFCKCMLKRLLDFCTKYNVIKKEQFGFQKDKSTTLAIFSLLKVIISNLNNKNITTGLFFDLSKAFDFVSHGLLLRKLEALGIRGPALQWLSSYLENRQQRVEITKINKKNEMISYSSGPRYIKNGVPQGSVLGPILFLLYINDITRITKHHCILYADDISIIVTSDKNTTTIKEHEQDINNTINLVIKWLHSNNLIINLDKSKYIQFNKSRNPKHNFNLDICSIEKATETRFLGVTIDENIDWKSQLDNICNRINRYVYALRQIRKVTNYKTAISCYHAYVESVLRYGLIMWGNSTTSERAFVAQKKCVRAMCGMGPIESCRPVFKTLGILPLPALYIFEMCVFVHKHKHLFTKACDRHPRACRDPDRLLIDDPSRLAKHKKSSLTMCVKAYNKIPGEYKYMNNNMFKNKLYEWMTTNNFYTINEFFDMDSNNKM